VGVGSWSEDEARSKLVALERSGMSLSAWCTQQNISPQRIYYWRDRLRQQPSTLPRLVEVAVQGRSAPVVSGPIEVVWPSGHVLRVPAAVGVAEVLRAVGLGPC
jgi:hypothetical protein